MGVRNISIGEFSEVIPAILASEAHRGARGASGPHAAAVRASGTFEPAFGCSVVGKLTEQVGDGQAGSARASGGMLRGCRFPLVDVSIMVGNMPVNNDNAKE